MSRGERKEKGRGWEGSGEGCEDTYERVYTINRPRRGTETNNKRGSFYLAYFSPMVVDVERFAAREVDF